ncbi:hypothetical protein MMC30_004410 [Trapelia coarctata]|nr:hypothetical protein [Trapelia coarctata]
MTASTTPGPPTRFMIFPRTIKYAVDLDRAAQSNLAEVARSASTREQPPPPDTQETLDCITLYQSTQERKRLGLPPLVPETPPKKLKQSSRPTKNRTSTPHLEKLDPHQSTESRDSIQRSAGPVSTQTSDGLHSPQPDDYFPSAQPRKPPDSNARKMIAIPSYLLIPTTTLINNEPEMDMDHSGVTDDDDHVRQPERTVREWILCQDSQVLLQDQPHSASNNPPAHPNAGHHAQQDEVEEEARAHAANEEGDPEATIAEAELGWDFLKYQGRDQESGRISNDVSSIQTARQTKALEYARLFDTSLVTLLKHVLFEECQMAKDFHSLDSRMLLYNTMLPILASTDATIIRHIINGNLARAWKKDCNVHNKLYAMLQRPNEQPAIYMQLLVDERGLSPSPARLSQVIDQMRFYYARETNSEEDIKRLIKIETSFNQRSFKYGRREHVVAEKLKYLTSASNKYSKELQISSSHSVNILAFANSLEHRLESYRNTPQWTQPLDAPLVEIGYTAAVKERLAAHRSHHPSSNYIMNLVEAICQVLWRDKFKMTQFVIFRIFNPPQAVAAEILFTRLAQGYTKDGGGFSHALAGRSNYSALEKNLSWNDFLTYATDHTCLMDTLQGELDIFEKFEEGVGHQFLPTFKELNRDTAELEPTFEGRGPLEESKVTFDTMGNRCTFKDAGDETDIVVEKFGFLKM